MRTISIAAAALLAVASGCGGDDGGSTSLEGIYQLASWTHNPDDCDAEGPAAFEESFYTHFFVKFESFFGEGFVTTVTCDDLEACRATAAEDDTIHIGNFAFEEGNDDDGWTGRGAFLQVGDASCMGEVFEAALTGDPESSVRIDEETKTVSGVPLDEMGDCEEQAAYDQAAPLPCEQLTVVMGTFLEGI